MKNFCMMHRQFFVKRLSKLNSIFCTFMTGNGYYMYIETSNGNTGYKADLVSKLLPPNAPAHPYCFGLALNMYGNQMGSINIYIKVRFKLF